MVPKWLPATTAFHCWSILLDRSSLKLQWILFVCVFQIAEIVIWSVPHKTFEFIAEGIKGDGTKVTQPDLENYYSELASDFFEKKFMVDGPPFLKPFWFVSWY